MLGYLERVQTKYPTEFRNLKSGTSEHITDALAFLEEPGNVDFLTAVLRRGLTFDPNSFYFHDIPLSHLVPNHTARIVLANGIAAPEWKSKFKTWLTDDRFTHKYEAIIFKNIEMIMRYGETHEDGESVPVKSEQGMRNIYKNIGLAALLVYLEATLPSSLFEKFQQK